VQLVGAPVPPAPTEFDTLRITTVVGRRLGNSRGCRRIAQSHSLLLFLRMRKARRVPPVAF
jgi:hypothetical protein